ncbi:protein kinase STUNTED-like [Magnolia sinica]|uniref:protein kinase STUNTED-like n=1 Tax=Magnolia sinica TaxID=86752 RepID=UPI00265886BA|nr:protein kinase STUNTED-like [Magnolia sinica]
MKVEKGSVEKMEEKNNVLVGIRIDSDSRELLNWALIKIAEPRDRVIAVHVCRDWGPCSKGNSAATVCLIKSLDDYLAVYQGLCSVRKVDLVGQVSRGNSIRKVLVREAKLCGATVVVVGMSKHNTFGDSLSLVRYCAKRLPPTISILAINNGKVIFQKDATKQLSGPERDLRRPSLHSILHPSLCVDAKVIIPSHKEEPDIGVSSVLETGNPIPNTVLNSDGGLTNGVGDVKEIEVEQDSPLTEKDDATKTDNNETRSSSSSACQSAVDLESLKEVEDDHFYPALEPPIKVTSSSISHLIRKLPESKPGWPLLRKASSAGSEVLKEKEARQMSVVEWVMHLPNRSSSLTPLLQIGSDKMQNPIGRAISECSDKSYKNCLSSWFEMPKELETILITNSSSCRWFTRKELQSSATPFSKENLIGKGGSSQVYEGCLHNGQPVAVKVTKSSKEAWKDFLLEVDIITSLQHKHILSLVGVCIEENDLISVYDFLSKGSLEENLQGKGEISVLPWEVRFKVAVGVAEALNYLHSDCSRPVIHRDVKSSNILLSDKFEPKLSDFGLAILAPATSTYVTHSDVVGTFGYLAPEYFMYGKVSDKIDVYSYGVVLLELLSGRKPISTEGPKGQESLVMWATPILESEDVTDLMDRNLGGDFNENQMQRMVMAASLCITRTARLRPRMSQVLKLLQGDEDTMKWAMSQANDPELDNQDEEAYPAPRVQSHQLGLTLLEGDDDTSVSSIEQNNHRSLEDFLRERWSRSSSFD